MWFLRLLLQCLHVLSQCGVSSSNVFHQTTLIVVSQVTALWTNEFTQQGLGCIHCMFCLSVACGTFHCPSPPIPSHFPALSSAYCIDCMARTAPLCILGAYLVHTTYCILGAYCLLHTRCMLSTAYSVHFTACRPLWNSIVCCWTVCCIAKLQYQRSFQPIPSSAKVMQSTAELAICAHL